MANVATTPWGRPFGIGPVEVLSNYNPGSTPTTYTLSLAAYTPKGTKAAQLWMRGFVTGVGNADMQIRKTSGSVPFAADRAATTSDTILTCGGWIELDVNRACDLYFSHLAFSAVYVWLSAGMIP